MKSFRHNGKLGDFLYALPAIRKLGGGRVILVKNKQGDEFFPAEILVSLLRQQPYISDVEVVDMEGRFGSLPSADFDFLPFRHQPYTHSQHLVHTHAHVLGMSLSDSDLEPWVECDKNEIAETVVSRRHALYWGDWNALYRSLDLNKCVFLGTPLEHQEFQQLYGIVPYHETSTFLEAAEIIKGSKSFVGNQGLLALAMAIGVPCATAPGMIVNDRPFIRTKGK